MGVADGGGFQSVVAPADNQCSLGFHQGVAAVRAGLSGSTGDRHSHRGYVGLATSVAGPRP